MLALPVPHGTHAPAPPAPGFHAAAGIYYRACFTSAFRSASSSAGSPGSGAEALPFPGSWSKKSTPASCSGRCPRCRWGVAVVSGTNGKTTTTKMVVELLESQGLKVFTNRTGSNFTRGVAAALLGEVDWRGRLDADVAVLELDEAHAVHFVNRVPPRYSLLLNVLRDQLDRFGEIDKTAELLQHIAVQNHRDRGPEPRGPARRPDRRTPWTGPRSSTSAWTTPC